MPLVRLARSGSLGRRARWVAALSAALICAALPAAPAAADADVVTSVTMVSETGDFVGRGTTRLFHPGNGSVSITGVPEYFTVHVSGGTLGDEFDLTFAPPPDEVLQPGEYDGAQRAATQAAGRPGMDISGDGRGCNALSGRFTVLDVAVDADGIDRLHLLFEQHCEGGQAALFGEIRYRVPAEPSDLLVAPGAIAWPTTYPGTASRPVPVTVVNQGASTATVGTPSITGTSADAFVVVGEGCTRPIAPGESCIVHVRFVPASAGRHTGQLWLPIGAGRYSVALRGDGDSGHTSWRMRGDPSEWITDGRSYDWTPSNARIWARGNDTLVEVTVQAADGYFTAQFAPGGHNNVLLPGVTYENAKRYAFSGTDPGLDVYGSGRGCNTLTGEFTVHEFAVGEYGLERFSVTFVQRCEEAPATASGSIAFRAQEPARPLPGAARPDAPTFSDIAGTTHEPSIETAAAWGVAGGYPDGTFRPGDLVTRGQMASFLVRAFDLPAAPQASFSDTAGSVHRAAIDSLVESGIASGYSDNRFRPTEPVTRAQMATFLDRALDLPAALPAGFTDTAGNIHAGAIDRIAAAGIAGGYTDGSYRPLGAVTRGQMATFLVRSLSG